MLTSDPTWLALYEYRVKAAPIVVDELMHYDGELGMNFHVLGSLTAIREAKVRFTVDPATKAVLSVELIKE